MKAYIVIIKKALRKRYEAFGNYMYETFGKDDKSFPLGEMSWAILSDKTADALHKEMTAHLPKGSQLFVFGWLGSELAQWTDSPEADKVLNEMYKVGTKNYIPLLNEYPRID